MVRTLPLNSETRPELPRILAMAAVILLHVLAFLLLLVPMANSPVEIAAPPPRWILPKEIPEPPLPPVAVPVVPQQQNIAQTNPPPQVQRPLANNPAIVEEGTLPATQENVLPSDVPDSIRPIDSSPVQLGTQLETIHATAPRYPREAARTAGRRQGTAEDPGGRRRPAARKSPSTRAAAIVCWIGQRAITC